MQNYLTMRLPGFRRIDGTAPRDSRLDRTCRSGGSMVSLQPVDGNPKSFRISDPAAKPQGRCLNADRFRRHPAKECPECGYAKQIISAILEMFKQLMHISHNSPSSFLKIIGLFLSDSEFDL